MGRPWKKVKMELLKDVLNVCWLFSYFICYYYDCHYYCYYHDCSYSVLLILMATWLVLKRCNSELTLWDHPGWVLPNFLGHGKDTSSVAAGERVWHSATAVTNGRIWCTARCLRDLAGLCEDQDPPIPLKECSSDPTGTKPEVFSGKDFGST